MDRAYWMAFWVEIGDHASRHFFQFGVICLFPQVHFVLCWLVDLYCMSVSMKTMSWSLIPGKGSYLLTSDDILDKTNTLSFLVRKETICSKLVSCFKSRNILFTHVGKLWLTTICVVHWMSDRLMSPTLPKTAPLLFLFNCPLVA